MGRRRRQLPLDSSLHLSGRVDENGFVPAVVKGKNFVGADEVHLDVVLHAVFRHDDVAGSHCVQGGIAAVSRRHHGFLQLDTFPTFEHARRDAASVVKQLKIILLIVIRDLTVHQECNDVMGWSACLRSISDARLLCILIRTVTGVPKYIRNEQPSNSVAIVLRQSIPFCLDQELLNSCLNCLLRKQFLYSRTHRFGLSPDRRPRHRHGTRCCTRAPCCRRGRRICPPCPRKPARRRLPPTPSYPLGRLPLGRSARPTQNGTARRACAASEHGVIRM